MGLGDKLTKAASFLHLGVPGGKGMILGDKKPKLEEIELDKAGGEEAQRRQGQTQDETAASEQALGGVVGASTGLARQGVNMGEIGRVSAAEQLSNQQAQQQQLLQAALGGGGGAGELAARQGIQAQQDAASSIAAGAGLMGRGGIAAQRQSGRAGNQLQLQGQNVIEQAQLQDQAQAQQLLGQTIGAGQQQAGQLGALGAEGALGGLGLQGQAYSGLLGGQLAQQGQFQNELLGREGLDAESDLRLKELMAQRPANTGFIGGLTNAVGGALGSFVGKKGGGEK